LIACSYTLRVGDREAVPFIMATDLLSKRCPVTTTRKSYLFRAFCLFSLDPTSDRGSASDPRDDLLQVFLRFLDIAQEV
jgi:hypothetical protein